MKTGAYTVESIENGQVKLLYRKDELIEELLPVASFDFAIKEGDLISIQLKDGKRCITYLQKETEDVKAYVKSLREQLLNRKQQ
ncbi:DUF3006 family protein [Bacillus massiliigorillae]|uniref:DUF3006 family protein n=1 Tax=Bacillus massiliigorillae TaxID=1243664 RepID=UPI00039A9016|nr:DUF3006 family protein [Bacillus massiliigorillae]